MIESMADRLFPNVDMAQLKLQLFIDGLVRQRGELMSLIAEGALTQSREEHAAWVLKCRDVVQRMQKEEEGSK